MVFGLSSVRRTASMMLARAKALLTTMMTASMATPSRSMPARTRPTRFKIFIMFVVPCGVREEGGRVGMREGGREAGKKKRGKGGRISG